MNLQDLLYKVSLESVLGSTNVDIADIQFDSRKIAKNNLFVAVSGTIYDGHKFISNAISDGAIAIIVEQFPEKIYENITYIKVKS